MNTKIKISKEQGLNPQLQPKQHYSSEIYFSANLQK